MKFGKVWTMIAVLSASLLSPGCPQESGTYMPGLEIIKERGYLKVGINDKVSKFGLETTDTGTGKKTYKGFEIDLAKLFAEAIFGVDPDESAIVELIPVTATATTRIDFLNNGKIDMIIATFTADSARRSTYHFSNPYYTDTVGMLVLKKREDEFKELENLKGKTIGVVQTTTTEAAIKESLNKDIYITLKFISDLSTYQDICDAIINSSFNGNDVDVFSIDKCILYGLNKQLLDEQCVETIILPPPFEFGEQPYGVATKLSKPDLAKFVDDYIVEWLDDENGTIKELREKWKLPPDPADSQ